MKTSNKILSATVLGIVVVMFGVAIAFKACATTDNQTRSWFGAGIDIRNKIAGNGKIANKEIAVGKFDVVNVGGQYDVVIGSGNIGKVTLTADENILPYLTAEVDDNQLNIGLQNGVAISTIKSPQATFNAQALHAINLSGGTTLQATNINSDNLTLAMSGKSSGSLQGDIKNLQLTINGKSELHVKIINAAQVNLNISGNGIVYLSGAVKNFSVSTAGKSTVFAQELVADNVSITGAGNADVTVHAVKTLSTTMAGNCDVKYYGSPAISKFGVGSVNIIKAE